MAYAGTPAGAVVSRGAGSAVTRTAPPRAASIRATAPIAQRVTLYVVAHPDGRHAVIEPTQLGDYEGLGFSLKNVVKNVAKTAVKAVKDTGHVAGKAVTSGVGKTILAGGLALTGVGIPAAAGIMAATQAGGALIKPGGNVGKAAKAGAQGAVIGAGAGVAGKVLTKMAPGVVTGSRKAFNKVTPGDTFKTDATGAAINAPKKRKTTVIPPVRPAGTPPGTPLVLKKVPDLVHGELPQLPPSTIEPAPPVLKVAEETDKKPGAKRTRIGALVDKAKKAAETVQQIEPSGGQPPVIYNPGTGPLGPTPEQAPTAPAKADLPMPLILAGVGALALIAMTRGK